MTNTTGRLTRWRLRLIEYDFNIVDRASNQNQAADALSQLFTEGTNYSGTSNAIPTMAVATWAQKILEEASRNASERTYIEKDEQPFPTIDQLMSAKGSDAYCDEINPTVEIPESSLILDRNRLLTRQLPKDGSVQKLGSLSLRPTILRLVHHSALAGRK